MSLDSSCSRRTYGLGEKGGGGGKQREKGGFGAAVGVVGPIDRCRHRQSHPEAPPLPHGAPPRAPVEQRHVRDSQDDGHDQHDAVEVGHRLELSYGEGCEGQGGGDAEVREQITPGCGHGLERGAR